MTSPVALRARDLAVWRGERCLFEGLDFDLAERQLAVVIGPNGAGKTTLLRVLAGLSLPSAGSLTWHGAPVGSLPLEHRGAIAYRGHLDGLKKDLTVLENLRFHAAIWGGGAALDPLLAGAEARRSGAFARAAPFGGAAATHGARDSEAFEREALDSRRADDELGCRGSREDSRLDQGASRERRCCRCRDASARTSSASPARW